MSMLIDIVRDGMAKDGSRAIKVLGDLLTEWLLENPVIAEMDAGQKTLSGAMEAIKDAARKQGGSWGVVDDREGLRIALAYLGVDSKMAGDSAPTPRATAPAARMDGELDLDALLGL